MARSVEDSLNATAFSLGSDARIAGQPVNQNPYFGHRQSHLRRSWEAGWYHVDRSWGAVARWPILSLPEIKEPRHGDYQETA